MKMNLFFLGVFLLLKIACFGSSCEEMRQYKEACLKEIQARGSSSFLSRIIKTVSAEDADFIPKDKNAGRIFEENGIRYQCMHNGIKVLEHGYYGSWMTDIIYALKGHHEPQEEKVFHEVLKWIPPESTMIELGSYWGYYSLWFAKEVPYAQNWLIEPDPENMKLGIQNFALNQKQAHFQLGYIQLHATDPITFSAAKKIHIDTFLKENGIEKVAILHSDIQGAEYQMLKTAQETLKDLKIDYLFISTHDSGVHEACKKFLLDLGYFIIAEHTLKESCSVDGLVVARSPKTEGPQYISVGKYHD